MAKRSSKSQAAVVVRVVRLPHGADLPLPAYQTEGAAGLDLVAAIPEGAALKLKKGARVLVPTGLVLEVPAGFEAQVRPRSGLALKHAITVLNSPGTIDSDYRGEVQVILANLGDKTFEIRRGERIAQMVIAPVTQATLAVVAKAEKTARGSGGFGSTGVAQAKVTKVAAAKATPMMRNASQKPASKSNGKAKPSAKGKAAKAGKKAAQKRAIPTSFPRRSLASSYRASYRTRRR